MLGHYTRRAGVRAPVISSVPSLGDFGSLLSPAQSPGNGTIQRDTNGRIKRSESAKHAFMRATGYPNGRSGYVVDHIVPLKRGGADDPSNMQWQTVEEAKRAVEELHDKEFLGRKLVVSGAKTSDQQPRG